MKLKIKILLLVFSLFTLSLFYKSTFAAGELTLSGSSSATGTVSVAVPITDLQIVGNSASTTPVKLLVSNGTLQMSTVTGLTFTGGQTGSTLYFSGTVANINNALATLTYTRGSVGTDTLEVSLVNSGEVFFTDNGHLYKFISTNTTWANAKTAAEGMTAYGASGYLATITSAEENAFIAGRLTADGWIGASDAAVEGDWKWVTGPETGTSFWSGLSNGSPVSGRYSNWSTGEPNQSGDEDCGQFYSASAKWNDYPCGLTIGYVVEFGATSSMPTVTAKNITLNTVAAPTVSSLSPADNASGVGLNSNLIMTFSSPVTASSGTISIKKVSDDSTIETISASSTKVSGIGTNTITINPDSTFQESTGYYVLVSSNAFKDGSNVFFGGISASSTWNFTTGDFTAPVISSVSATSSTSTASVTWTTNEQASSKVSYGLTNSFSTSTAETDTSPRVTSHTTYLTGLLPCSTYYFSAISKDSSLNSATSTMANFNTLGCPSNTSQSQSTSTSISAAAGGSTNLADGNSTIIVNTPANFTSSSTSVVIQIQSLPGAGILDTLGQPAGTSKVGEIIFDVKAIINSNTILDSFSAPITIIYQYSDAEVAGLDENSLRLYHYHNSQWEMLDNCSVNTGTNVITCSTNSFSLFSIFGSPLAQASSSTGGIVPPQLFIPIKAPENGFGISINNNALYTTSPNVTLYLNPGSDIQKMSISNYPDFKDAGIINFSTTTTWTLLNGDGVKTVYIKFFNAWGKQSEIFSDTITLNSSSNRSISPSNLNSFVFTKNLQLGSSGPEVLALQKFLNSQGYLVSSTGPGSTGNETNLFGRGTKSALIKYQNNFAKEILFPTGLKSGTGYFGQSTRNFINKIIK